MKQAIKDESKVGEYEVNISVPGKEVEKKSGYNIIFVIDGSYSTDGNTWKTMRKAVIDTVDTLLPNDSSENLNSVALISFGINYHVNIPLTSNKKVFEESLPSEKGGSLLLPGRSATNTEVGLKGARLYIESLKGTSLEKDSKHTYIIYLSDGRTNMNEQESNWYQLVKDATIVRGKINTLEYFKNNILDSLTIFSDVVKTSGYENVSRHKVIDDSISKIEKLYNEKVLGTDILLSEKISKLSSLYKDDLDNLLMDIISDFYNSIGYDLTKSYSVGEYESMVNSIMFVDRNIYYRYVEDDSNNMKIELSNKQVYDEKGEAIYSNLNSLVEDGFYIPMFYNGTNSTTNINRTIEEGLRLKKYANIYTIGVNATTNTAKLVLDPTYGENKEREHYSTEYYQSTADGIKETFDSLLYSITKINYKNPIVVDYTSKWIIPVDTNGDFVFDEKDIVIKNGDKVVENAKVKVQKLTKEDVDNSSDLEIVGNTNGDIYKITWEIADYLRSWDKYSLSYKVEMDVLEDSFESEKKYKTNGDTILRYDIVEKDDASEKIISEGNVYKIDVPFGSQKNNVLIVSKKDEFGYYLKGADFDILSSKNVEKEYSIDGKTWTKSNDNNDAVMFRFSNLYDFNYTLKEIKTPSSYNTSLDKEISFVNLEGNTKNIDVTNEYKKGTLIVHYVDLQGNKLCKDVNVQSLVGEEYTTKRLEFDGYSYSSVKGNVTGKYIDGVTEVSYIYKKVDYPLPPKTGC